MEKEISIDFEKIPPERMQKDYQSGDLIVSATTQVILTEKREKQFRDIKSPLSNSIQEFIKTILLELYDCILKTIKGLRWRLRNESSTNPIRFWGGYRYSADRKTWRAFPDQVSLDVIWGLPVKKAYDKEEIESAQGLISEGKYEPLGHELLHEAWELRKSNPRSALVIGLAAAETGFKQFSSQLIPEASWLIQNAPSPPLIKMLANFLPQIPTKNKIFGKVIAPSQELLACLDKGVTIRNEIVHGKNSNVKKETVDEVLNSVRDLLYLLDFYYGYTWAWSYVNGTVLNSMIATAKK